MPVVIYQRYRFDESTGKNCRWIIQIYKANEYSSSKEVQQLVDGGSRMVTVLNKMTNKSSNFAKVFNFSQNNVLVCNYHRKMNDVHISFVQKNIPSMLNFLYFIVNNNNIFGSASYSFTYARILKNIVVFETSSR